MKKTVCEQCKKKLGLLHYQCKCEKLFCITHLSAETHNCTYNYKEEGKKILQKEMDTGVKKSLWERI